MSLRRFLAGLATLAMAATVAVVAPATANAATCAAAYSATQVYTGGMTASYNGDNWLAKWWTQGEAPSTGGSGVWADQGACTGGSGGGGGGGGTTGFVVSEAQFNQMFPSRNSFYTYAGLTAAIAKFPAFATTGSDTVKKQEAAAFLANVSHETGGLVYITEIDKSGNYCDTSQSYGCPAGTYAYYGRGPLQLSWNFNYYAAGNYLSLNLLGNPYLVEQDPSVAWQTGLWYWFTGTGATNTASHTAMVNGQGFGATIRAINGGLECDGHNTAQMQDRVNLYQQYAALLGVSPGSNLTC
ncbi:glycoside hydrolase family 19 protein [Kutzneria sp. NPDC052558]|uniref:glycoside hydrolase family 19 protein n=1 Tax=Kutzneria sp. NPDC052558 TaxID=3364121 RepID=UPI0037C9F654